MPREASSRRRRTHQPAHNPPTHVPSDPQRTENELNLRRSAHRLAQILHHPTYQYRAHRNPDKREAVEKSKETGHRGTAIVVIERASGVDCAETYRVDDDCLDCIFREDGVINIWVITWTCFSAGEEVASGHPELVKGEVDWIPK